MQKVAEVLGRAATKLMGSRNERVLESMQPLVDRISELEPEMMRLSDSQLRKKTEEFRNRLADGETLDDLLCEAFAVMREACRRVILTPSEDNPQPMRHFDVQLIGGIVLHRGMIAEMATGEGKTLVATLAAYLNGLEAKGVHVVTTNDYLARRDKEWMGPAFEFLGMTVGVIQHDMSPAERREAYACDVTYGRNDELGFDYLRNNMAVRLEDQAQGRLHYAIIDEVDSILIDEARTPLIITGPTEEFTDKYYLADKAARSLKGLNKAEFDARVDAGEEKDVLDHEYDFVYSEKDNTAHMTDRGVQRAQKILGVDDFYTGANMDWPHRIMQALRAHHLQRRDRDYVVKDRKVVIVDEFTGRLMPGRRWSDGLHQAIEAKEGLRIERETQTMATITYQNFFRLYDKLAGMTGTALTEAAEFDKIYSLEVMVLPTNKPLRRTEHADVVYRTEKEKFAAIEEEIATANEEGRPLLVGTVSIENSERLSGHLKRRGIKHEVLNAKHHEREAAIIAKAGQRGNVTIATNMAGRGVDIVLGTGVAEMGGLYVLGTERHEARRIDNQLQGRAGRQGDPGSSRFFLSLEDDLMRLFASDWVSAVLRRLGMEEGVAIENRIVSRAIERAQKKVEEYNFESRKRVLDYDEVMDEQRRVIYEMRQRALEGKDLGVMVMEVLEESAANAVAAYLSPANRPDEWDRVGLEDWLGRNFGVGIDASVLGGKSAEGIEEQVVEKVLGAYRERREVLGDEAAQRIEQFLLLRAIDTKWKDHLYAMDSLKQGIGLRGYAQRDPVIEYKREAFELFEEMVSSVRDEVTELIFKLRLEAEDVDSYRGVMRVASEVHEEYAAMQRAQQAAVESSKAAEGKVAQIKVGTKVGRNDPCPCGSGKKFKKCCGRAGE